MEGVGEDAVSDILEFRLHMSIASPGTRLGPYELLAPAGAGGMGEVWKARDTRVDRVVAIKFAQQQFSERFEREARATAALNHPNICALYDVGPDYLVMEYVEGAPIRPVQSGRKLLDLAVQIADGLAAAHDRGITHRDLKPDNILVTGPGSGDPGRVKILDFGLAKQEAEAPEAGSTMAVTATQPGTVMGTVHYMSPEQARGMPLDTRSDQFSFGVILYELASGKRPFQGDSTPQTLTAIIEAEPEPLPQTVAAPLRWIIERCLAKDAAERYESTRDLFRELSLLREHITEVVSGSGAAAASGKGRRLKGLRAAGLTACVLLAAGASYLAGTRSHGTTAALIPTPLTSSGGEVLNPSFSPDGSELIFAWGGPRAGNNNLYVKLIGSNDLLRLTNGPAEELSPAWSPDGKQIAFVRSLGPRRRALMLISPLGGSERMLTELRMDDYGPEEHAVLAWTPDSKYLAAATGNHLDVVSAETGERQALTKEAPDVLGDVDPAFSRDGRRLAFVRRLGPFSSRALWVPLGGGGDSPPRAEGAPQEIPAPGVVTFSPLWVNDGKLLLAAGAPFALRLYRVSVPGGTVVRVPSADIGGGMAMHLATGRLVYSAQLNIWNLYRVGIEAPGKTSQTPERLTATSGADFFSRYSPDGASVAFVSFRFGQFGIWTIQTQNTVGAGLAEWGDGMVAASDWAPDGKSMLVFGTGPRGMYQIYRLAVDTRKVTRLLDEPRHDVYPTYSRDGKTIYFSASGKQGLQLYKMPSGGGAAALVVGGNAVEARESADGRWLYFSEYMPPYLDRMPMGGGEVTRLIGPLAEPTGYALTCGGAYYWASGARGMELRYMELETRRDRLVLRPAIPAVPHLTMSPDGRWLCFPLVERKSKELMMVGVDQ